MNISKSILIIAILALPSVALSESYTLKYLKENGYKEEGKGKVYQQETTKNIEIQVQMNACTAIGIEFSKNFQWSEGAKKKRIVVIERDGGSSVTYAYLAYDEPEKNYTILGCDEMKNRTKVLNFELYEMYKVGDPNIGKGEFTVRKFTKASEPVREPTREDIAAQEREMAEFKESNRQKACMECAQRHPARDADFDHCVQAYGVNSKECY